MDYSILSVGFIIIIFKKYIWTKEYIVYEGARSEKWGLRPPNLTKFTPMGTTFQFRPNTEYSGEFSFGRLISIRGYLSRYSF